MIFLQKRSSQFLIKILFSFLSFSILYTIIISCVKHDEFNHRASQSQIQYQKTLNKLYLEAKSPDTWPAEIKNLTTEQLRSNLQKFKKDKIEFAATCYALIFKSDDRDNLVSLMVESALQNAGTFYTYEEDALSALPEALKTIYIVTKSKDALEKILYLQLDGGPAETLWYVGLDILREFPLNVAGLLGDKHDYNLEVLLQKENLPPFVKTLQSRISEEEVYLDDFKKLVDKYSIDKTKQADFFCKLILKVVYE